MTTARETLAKQLQELLKGAPGADAGNKVSELLDQYRVQAKPGTEVQAGITARESLGKQVAALWKRAPKDMDRSVDALLDKYRMQAKREGEDDGPPKKPAAKPAVMPATPRPAVTTAPPRPGAAPANPVARATITSPAAAKAVSGTPRTTAARTAEAPPPARKPLGNAPLPPPPRAGALPTIMAPRAAPQSVTPLFPGTPTGPSKRSECPKCKSRGVVLARSYTQEEYFSCIYCGWQAFKPFEEANADSPLAARLMAQRPSLPQKSKEDEDEGGGRRRSVLVDDDEDGRRGRGSVVADDDLPGGGPAVRPADGLDEDDLANAGLHEVDDADGEGDALDSLGGDDE